MSAEQEEKDGFLHRWSARKAGGTRTSSPANSLATDTPPAAPAGHVSTTLGEGGQYDAEPSMAEPSIAAKSTDRESVCEVPSTEEPLLTDDDMPPLTSLTAHSDLRQFFNRGVSKALRQAALSHVFRLPAYNVRDGLNEYDDDYTQFEPLGDTVTADMRFHAARRERERLAKLDEQAQLTEQAHAPDVADENSQRDTVVGSESEDFAETDVIGDAVTESELESEPERERKTTPGSAADTDTPNDGVLATDEKRRPAASLASAINIESP